jgi:GT2 family glycosyltransferase
VTALAPRREPAHPGTGRVSVVIATRNRRAELVRTLRQLTALPERPRLVVVDNGSSDGTAAAVRDGFPGAELVVLRQNRGAWARNVGVTRSRTAYVALSDDDSWWEPGSLGTAAAVLDACPQAGLLAARVLVGAAARPDPANAAMSASPLPRGGLPGPRVLGFLGCAAVLRRTAFLAAGGFSRLLFIGGEEQLLAYDLAAAGWPACYVPEVVARHHPSAARDDAARAYQLSRNRVLVAWMRRPVRHAAAETASLAGRARREPAAARALAGALARLPVAVAQRRALPADVEAAARLLGH